MFGRKDVNEKLKLFTIGDQIEKFLDTPIDTYFIWEDEVEVSPVMVKQKVSDFAYTNCIDEFFPIISLDKEIRILKS